MALIKSSFLNRLSRSMRESACQCLVAGRSRPRDPISTHFIGGTARFRLASSRTSIKTLYRVSSTSRSTLSPNTFLSTRLSSTTTKSSSRLDRLEARLPIYLQRYTRPLRAAPVSHVTSFAILHELTAIVPLFGLAGVFHYTQWVPLSPGDWEWGRQGMARFDRWLRRKGWITDADTPNTTQQSMQAVKDGNEGTEALSQTPNTSLNTSPIVIHLAVAWAITKALLPVRLAICAWATPWFARRAVLPVTRILGSLGRRT